MGARSLFSPVPSGRSRAVFLRRCSGQTRRDARNDRWAGADGSGAGQGGGIGEFGPVTGSRKRSRHALFSSFSSRGRWARGFASRTDGGRPKPALTPVLCAVTPTLTSLTLGHLAPTGGERKRANCRSNRALRLGGRWEPHSRGFRAPPPRPRFAQAVPREGRNYNAATASRA